MGKFWPGSARVGHVAAFLGENEGDRPTIIAGSRTPDGASLSVEVNSCLLPLPAVQIPQCGVQMTEERKHAILFAATLLCARKLIETIESDKPNMAEQFFIDRAIQKVESVMERIDYRWPEAGEPGVAKSSSER